MKILSSVTMDVIMSLLGTYVATKMSFANPDSCGL
jgi:hypothetical protein